MKKLVITASLGIALLAASCENKNLKNSSSNQKMKIDINSEFSEINLDKLCDEVVRNGGIALGDWGSSPQILLSLWNMQDLATLVSRECTLEDLKNLLMNDKDAELESIFSSLTERDEESIDLLREEMKGDSLLSVWIDLLSEHYDAARAGNPSAIAALAGACQTAGLSLNRGDSGEAGNIFWKLHVSLNLERSLQKDSEGLFELGYSSEIGRGVIVSKSLARDFYRLSFDGGHGEAGFRLGQLIESTDGDRALAFKIYEQAAVKSEQAAYRAGMMLWNGEGVAVSEAKSIQMLRIAAAEGLREAQCNLGAILMRMDENTEAVKWLALASGQEDPLATYYMGVAYANGFGVDRNDKLAGQFFRKSKRLGYDNVAEKYMPYLVE